MSIDRTAQGKTALKTALKTANKTAKDSEGRVPSSASDPKTAIKTAKPSPRNGVALPVGAHPGNTGGKKGRSGRPTDDFKSWLAVLRSSADFRSAVRAAAYDPNSRHFGHVLRLIAEYDDEKPAAKRQIVGPVDVRVRITREARRTTAG